MKNSLFDSLFSSESYVFLPLEFVLFEKVPFISLYSQTIGVWGDSQTMWDLFQTKFKCRKFAFYSFWNPSMRADARVYVCILELELKHAYAYTCMRAPALRFPWPFFFKKSLFVPKISYIFHKNFP